MKKAEELKEEILQKTKEYYELVHKPLQEHTFVKGDRVNYAGRVFDAEEMLNLVESSLDFWLTYGKYSKTFEKDLSAYMGMKYTLLVNSGSSANLLAFFALTSPLLKERQVHRGDEVITVAAAFPTTIAPILQYGAVPVFVDMELEHINIDIRLLEEALSSKTKAVMIAHTLGNPFDIAAIQAFCKKHNLWLIEDNCDALGSLYNGKLTGTFGDIGTSSFYPPHHITMGEGGAVYTDNPLLKKIMLSMRDWGRDCWCESGVDNSCGMRFSKQYGSLSEGYDHKYVYSHLGFNLKPTDMQAAIGVAQLQKVDDFTHKRITNFTKLYSILKEVPYLKVIEPQKNSVPSWFGCFIRVINDAPFSRNELVNYLEAQKIQTRNLFSGNILRQPIFDTLCEGSDYRVVGSLENTDTIMRHGFWIGVYPGMSDEALEYMAQTIKDFVSKYDR